MGLKLKMTLKMKENVALFRFPRQQTKWLNLDELSKYIF